jgi:hypothetical protein
VTASVSAPADADKANPTTQASAPCTTAAATSAGNGTTRRATSSPVATAEPPAAAPWRFSNVSIHTIEHIDAPIGELMSHDTQSTIHQLYGKDWHLGVKQSCGLYAELVYVCFQSK